MMKQWSEHGVAFPDQLCFPINKVQAARASAQAAALGERMQGYAVRL
jgi:hypothetical protein